MEVVCVLSSGVDAARSGRGERYCVLWWRCLFYFFIWSFCFALVEPE